MTSPRCDLCRFWDEYTGLNDDNIPDPGKCRRYPPVRQKEGRGLKDVDFPEGMDWTMPDTQGNDWCGEFQPTPKPLPPIVDGLPIPAEYTK